MRNWSKRANLVQLAMIALGAYILGAFPAVAAYQFKAIYSFCAQQNCIDGSGPPSGLLMDSSGNLYGTTFYGGENGGGTVFMLSPAEGQWTETVLYSFCSKPQCADGQEPNSALIMDTSGALYGVTYGGGRT